MPSGCPGGRQGNSAPCWWPAWPRTPGTGEKAESIAGPNHQPQLRGTKQQSARASAAGSAPALPPGGPRTSRGDTYRMPPDAGSCESPAPAAAPPPAALAMTSAGTASAAPRRLRRLGPTPGQLPHAWPPPRRLAPDRHARPQRDGQERRRARLRHRHPPSPVCQAARKIPRDAPEAGGRFGRTAHPPAVTSPGTHHPKPGALGAGGTAASSDKSSRKKLKSRRVLPSLAATPRNEKIRSFLGSERKKKRLF